MLKAILRQQTQDSKLKRQQTQETANSRLVKFETSKILRSGGCGSWQKKCASVLERLLEAKSCLDRRGELQRSRVQKRNLIPARPQAVRQTCQLRKIVQVISNIDTADIVKGDEVDTDTYFNIEPEEIDALKLES